MDEFSKAANEINRMLRTELAKDEAKADPYQDAKNALYSLEAALLTLQAAKPGERGELARRYAVTITELEKTVAYFETWVIKGFFQDERGVATGE